MELGEASSYKEDSFTYNGREILYATAGKEGGHPALCFYPLGSSRRALPILENAARAADLWLICCNRPGKGTDRPLFSEQSDQSAAACQLDTAVEDLKHLMDELSVEKASLIFLCAGTPFALRFASKYPERILQTLGIGCWVSPADCDKMKHIFQFASRLPTWLITTLGHVSDCSASLGRWLPETPQSLVVSMLDEAERPLFKSDDDGKAASQKLAFAKSEVTGGDDLDIPLLLSSYQAIGLELPSPENLKLIHSKSDELIPIDAARWLAAKMGTELQELESNSHTGCLLLFHPSLQAAINGLSNPTARTKPLASGPLE